MKDEKNNKVSLDREVDLTRGGGGKGGRGRGRGDSGEVVVCSLQERCATFFI